MNEIKIWGNFSTILMTKLVVITIYLLFQNIKQPLSYGTQHLDDNASIPMHILVKYKVKYSESKIWIHKISISSVSEMKQFKSKNVRKVYFVFFVIAYKTLLLKYF